MTPTQFYDLILEPAASAMTDAGASILMDSAEARCQLLAIAGQESGWAYRTQIPSGQAHGFWQCQQNGAVAGVIKGPHGPLLTDLADVYGLPIDAAGVWAAIEFNDLLAYTMARLALWMDPAPLPEIGDEDGAWEVYERVWRPGKPSRDRWSSVYPQAVAVIQG